MTNKIIGFAICIVAGGIGAWTGELWGAIAVILGELGVILAFIKD